MNATLTAPAASQEVKIDAYVVGTSGHRATYHQATLVRKTKTTIVVLCNGQERTFTNVEHGPIRERGTGLSTWNRDTLDFDVAKCARIVEERKAQQALSRRASDAIVAIKEALTRKHNGMGGFCGTEEDVVKLENALAALLA
jgi:hypothetical protein